MSVYSIKVKSVGHGYITTSDDVRLVCTGNRTFYPGETAWTDGRFVYGMETKHGGSIIGSSAYFPYLSNNRCFGRMTKGGNCKRLTSTNWDVDGLIVGRKASYAITYTPRPRCLNLETGQSFDIADTSTISKFLDATVDDNGNLISAWRSALYDYNKGGCGVIIAKNGSVINRISPPIRYDGYGHMVSNTPFVGRVEKDGRFQGLFSTDGYNISSSHSNSQSSVDFTILAGTVYCQGETVERPDGSLNTVYYQPSNIWHNDGDSLDSFQVAIGNGADDPYLFYPLRNLCFIHSADSAITQEDILFKDTDGDVKNVCRKKYLNTGYGVGIDVKNAIITLPNGYVCKVRAYHSANNWGATTLFLDPKKYKEVVVMEFQHIEDVESGKRIDKPWYVAVAVSNYEEPSRDKGSCRLIGATSSPFSVDMAGGRVTYEIRAYSIGEGRYSTRHDITTKIKDAEIETKVSDVVYWTPYWWVADVYKNYVLTAKGCYKFDQKQIGLLNDEFCSYERNTRLIEMDTSKINKFAKKIKGIG